MPQITVKNASKRPVTLLLDHQDAPRAKFQFLKHEVDKASGAILSKRHELRLPGSLTIAVGEVRTGLPFWLKAAAEQRGLKVFVQADEPDAVIEAAPEFDFEVAERSPSDAPAPVSKKRGNK